MLLACWDIRVSHWSAISFLSAIAGWISFCVDASTANNLSEWVSVDCKMLIWLVFLELLACVMNLCQQRSILMLTQERNFRAIIIASRLVSLKLLLDSCPTDTIPQVMIDYRRKQLLLFLIGRQFIWFENLLPQSKLAICCLDCRGMVRMARHFPGKHLLSSVG